MRKFLMSTVILFFASGISLAEEKPVTRSVEQYDKVIKTLKELAEKTLEEDYYKESKLKNKTTEEVKEFSDLNKFEKKCLFYLEQKN